MQDFRRLTVWADAHALTLELYGATRDFPDSERLGPTSRLRRASASIPANFAEGCGGGADFARFVQIATGSTCEVEYHLQLAHDLGYLKQQIYEQLDSHAVRVKRMLLALLKKLRK